MTSDQLRPHAAYLYALRTRMQEGKARKMFVQMVREVTQVLLLEKYDIAYLRAESWMDRVEDILSSGITISDAAREHLLNPSQGRGRIHLDHTKSILTLLQEIDAAKSVKDVERALLEVDFQFLSGTENIRKGG